MLSSAILSSEFWLNIEGYQETRSLVTVLDKELSELFKEAVPIIDAGFEETTFRLSIRTERTLPLRPGERSAIHGELRGDDQLVVAPGWLSNAHHLAVSAMHLVADLTRALGEVVHDYLAKSESPKKKGRTHELAE